jgi:HD-GYP domain-containing protein (c-di-GMP phosphodiesterase class II)
MKKLDNSALVPGMVLARDVVNLKSGLLIISEGLALTPEVIDKLRQLEINEIYVKELSAALEEEHEKLLEGKIAASHDRVVNRAKKLLDSTVTQPPALEILQSMVGDLKGQIELNSNVLLNLSYLKKFDDYLFSHVVNVAMLALIIGRQLQLRPDTLHDLGIASLLHDFGMSKLEHSVYDHDRPLTDAEWDQVRRHPEYSVAILQETGQYSQAVQNGVADHHERLDGSGYPRHKKGAEISFLGKIIAVADVYDACISPRKYRPPQMPHPTLKNLLNESQLFDLEILKAFVTAMGIYPIGSYVRLSTGAIAKVVGCNPKQPFRPDVRVILDQSQRKLDVPFRMKLTEEANFQIYIAENLTEEEFRKLLPLLAEEAGGQLS